MIKPIPYYKTIPFHDKGKKHGLMFKENTNYVGYYIKKELVAVAGYDVLKSKCIIRSAYVIEEHRGCGIYDKLVQHRIALLKEKGHKKFELTCTKMSLPYHLKRGAEIVKEYKHYTKIRYYENIQKAKRV